MLRDITGLLERNSITYWLESGTLLGVIRDKDHLLTHRNIDIGISASQINSVLKLKKKLAPRYRIKLHRNRSGKDWIGGEITRIRIIRMWEQMRNADTMICIKVKYKRGSACHWIDHRSCKSVPAQFYDNLDTIGFNNRPYPVPSDTTNYLAACYGDWRTPQKYFQNRIDELTIAGDDALKTTPSFILPKPLHTGKSAKIQLEGKYLARMMGMLFETLDLLERYGIKYWIDDGTLLGIIREGGLIPWDFDVDLGIAGQSVPRLLELKYRFLPKYILRHKTIDNPWIPGGIKGLKVKTIWEKLININFHIDLFAKYKVGDRYQWIDSGALKRIECRYYDNLEHIKWKGRTIPIPAHPEDYLAIRYGDWRTPTKDYNPSIDDGAIAENGFKIKK